MEHLETPSACPLSLPVPVHQDEVTAHAVEHDEIPSLRPLRGKTGGDAHLEVKRMRLRQRHFVRVQKGSKRVSGGDIAVDKAPGLAEEMYRRAKATEQTNEVLRRPLLPGYQLLCTTHDDSVIAVDAARGAHDGIGKGTRHGLSIDGCQTALERRHQSTLGRRDFACEEGASSSKITSRLTAGQVAQAIVIASSLICVSALSIPA